MPDTPTPADAPFDQPSADIVLRSVDRVDFRAHRVILAQASPFFADMFSLPQRSPPDVDALPVVDMSEDSKTLRRLLLLCYPVDKQELESVADIAPVLAAARKFDMEWPVRLLARDLTTSVSRSPLRAWSCACQSGLEDVAHHAAEEIKRRASSKAAETPEGPDSGVALLSALRAALEEEGLMDVLQGVSGGAYFRLREYLRGASPSFSISPGSNSSTPSNTLEAVIIALRLPGISVATPAPSPNGSYVELATKGDRVLEASTPQQGAYTLDAPSTALVNILALCYRGKSDTAYGADFDGLARALAVSGKIPMDAQMLNAPRQVWEQCVEINPFRAYFAAAKSGLGEEDIRAAARKTLAVPLLGFYSGRLEHADAIVYERLLKYHHDASVAVVGVLAHVGENWSKNLRNTFPHHFMHMDSLPVTPAQRINDAAHKLSVGQHAPAMLLEAMGIDISTLIEAALRQRLGIAFSRVSQPTDFLPIVVLDLAGIVVAVTSAPRAKVHHGVCTSQVATILALR
ncbi:uncharacterized protein BXZ73DRAFT_97891 [Epithele typhae]|uniref:uncharacterized protein n=1 Tax=Epithele typhae TaxID=378194 RepID=UPI0020083CA8|nr:uncharacterized protein BXZ73DRAFT_97891 [Epithele typhae]KAH9942481.1 hypothetical protein BXZ73DRAFT_97891 [Epithele typhae]